MEYHSEGRLYISEVNAERNYSDCQCLSFEKIGIVTDVKIIWVDDGQSRKFGFVGFKSEKHAQAAQEYFNGTYLLIGTSKI